MKKQYVALFISLFLVFLFSGCTNENNPKSVFDQYAKSWEKQDYGDMYEKLSVEGKGMITKEEFQKSYEDFYKDLGVKTIKVENLVDEKKLKNQIKNEDQVKIPIEIDLKTTYGDKSYRMGVVLVKEEVDKKEIWNIDWQYNMIYKDMAEGDTIKTRNVAPGRGEILDRNGLKLAENGSVIQVGIVPGRLGDMKEEIISDLAKTFAIKEQYIHDRLNLSWVNDDTFVDIIKIPKEQATLIEGLNVKNSGATYKEVKERVYPYKEIAAHLTGYLGYINDNELKELGPLGFTAGDKVGRTGIEKVFDKSLRGTPGQKVVIKSSDGQEKEVLSEKGAINGEDLRVTIDIDLQTKLYSQMGEEQGTATSMNYKTGEIMALISSPSYDPNRFILGMGSDEFTKLQESSAKPLLNRFAKVYSPGSTLKPITESIALNENKVDESFIIDVKGLNWKKDASWGNYSITRVKDPGTPVNLEKAMLYSDNIYFGQVALKIGAETFVEKAKGFGIGEDLKIRYGVEQSQLATNNQISSEVLLADSGYGQGQVLLNILNLPKAYSAFVNKGNVIEPKLIIDHVEPKSTNVISEDVANKILTLMTKVVADQIGTGHEAYIQGKTIAGKTGTAEVNSADGATQNKELGWFAAIDINDENPYITTMMIEGVQGRGGSHFVVPKVRQFIESYSDSQS